MKNEELVRKLFVSQVVLWVIILLAILLTNCGPGWLEDGRPAECLPFNKVVIDSLQVENGGDLAYRLYTQWAVYGMDYHGDTVTRQPMNQSGCHLDLIYGPDWVQCCKPN